MINMTQKMCFKYVMFKMFFKAVVLVWPYRRKILKKCCDRHTCRQTGNQS